MYKEVLDDTPYKNISEKVNKDTIYSESKKEVKKLPMISSPPKHKKILKQSEINFKATNSTRNLKTPY